MLLSRKLWLNLLKKPSEKMRSSITVWTKEIWLTLKESSSKMRASWDKYLLLYQSSLDQKLVVWVLKNFSFMMNSEKKGKIQCPRISKLFLIRKDLSRLGLKEHQSKYIVRFYQPSLPFATNCSTECGFPFEIQKSKMKTNTFYKYSKCWKSTDIF